jgi:flagellin-like protein
MNRGQSSVIGVALLIAATVVAVAGMTAAVGTVIEDRATTAGTDRVAATFDDALDPSASGTDRDRVALPGGRLRVVERTLRVRSGGRTIAAYEVGGLVYAADDRRATYVSGAVVRSTPAGAAVGGDLPVQGGGDGDLFVSPVVLGGDPGRGTSAEAVTLRTNVTHARRSLAPGNYQIAIETRSPDAWTGRLDAVGSTTRTDIDGDGVPSVVVEPSGTNAVYVTVHRLRLEVTPA